MLCVPYGDEAGWLWWDKKCQNSHGTYMQISERRWFSVSHIYNIQKIANITITDEWFTLSVRPWVIFHFCSQTLRDNTLNLFCGEMGKSTRLVWESEWTARDKREDWAKTFQHITHRSSAGGEELSICMILMFQHDVSAQVWLIGYGDRNESWNPTLLR